MAKVFQSEIERLAYDPFELVWACKTGGKAITVKFKTSSEIVFVYSNFELRDRDYEYMLSYLSCRPELEGE